MDNILVRFVVRKRQNTNGHARSLQENQVISSCEDKQVSDERNSAHWDIQNNSNGEC